MVLLPPDLERFITLNRIAADAIVPAIETPTVPAAAAAMGVSPAQIIKSLLFLVRGEPVLVIASGDILVDRRVLADHFHTGKKQVRLADPEIVLRLTGYPVGGVPPFGHRTRMPTLVDRHILNWDVVYGGGGNERTLLSVRPEELMRVVEGVWIDLGD